MQMKALTVTSWLGLVALGCSDDPQRAADTAAPDAVDTVEASEPEAIPAICEASITEVDRGFVEVVIHNDCADWSLAIRDGAVPGCALAAEVFFPRGVERIALEGFQVPATAVIILQNPKLDAIAVWTVGTCEPDASCLGFLGDAANAEQRACLPADTTTGTISLCGDQWVADKLATPGDANDCACKVDCQKAAGVCQTGSCVDGACAFAPRDEGQACSDNNQCTTGDRCSAGACAGEAVVCAPPAGPCEEPGACSPQTGECVYVDTCLDNAQCTANGCACRPGFNGDGVSSCNDIDECADDDDGDDAGCHPLAHCVNQVGGYACVCPLGYAGDGRSCAPTSCACPWEDANTCGPELRRLRVNVVDLWAQPIPGATLSLVDVPSHQVIRAEDLGGWQIDEPLCAARDFDIAVAAADHHAFAGKIQWLENDITVQSEPSADSAWAITWDAEGPVLWVGLAHRWFAAAAPPARHGNRVDLLMDGESGWGTLYAELQLAQRLVTGTSWRWESELEIVRPADHLYLDPEERWHNTLIGALEDLIGVEKKIMVGQFISQDGIFSNISVDDELLEKGETPGDDFEYMGQANPTAGEFTITPPSVDFAAQVLAAHPTSGDLIDEAPADPYRGPISVDMTEIPLGLSLFDLPIASWHQKFWTIDQEVAFVGGMNAQTLDWDSGEHRVFDPRRMEFDASTSDREDVAAKQKEPDFPPRKDYMTRLEGPIVRDVVDVFDRRWDHQLDEDVEYADRSTPVDVEPTSATFADGLQAQLVATMPDPFDDNAILETLVRAVSQAKHMIYIEDQYFRAPILYDRIVQRMTEVPNLILVVVTVSVSEWVDLACFQTSIAHQRFRSLFPDRFRIYRLRAFDYVRTDCTFCWDETEAHFVDVDLHSKLVLIDDEYLEVGSCNSNNRGLLYEGELAVAIHDRTWVKGQRKRIFEAALGPGYDGDMPYAEVLAAFDERANENQRAYNLWDDEGMDVDLDGAPVAGEMIPSGPLYPLSFDVPDACLIEGVGGDIM